MQLGSETFLVQPRYLIIMPPNIRHSLVADQSPVEWFDLAFHAFVWQISAEAIVEWYRRISWRPDSRLANVDRRRKTTIARGRHVLQISSCTSAFNFRSLGSDIAMNLELVRLIMFMKNHEGFWYIHLRFRLCLLYTSPSPRD